MKKSGIIILILCVLGCCVAGGSYYLSKNNQSSESTVVSSNTTPTSNNNTDNTNTISVADTNTNSTTKDNSSANLGTTTSTNTSQNTNFNSPAKITHKYVVSNSNTTNSSETTSGIIANNNSNNDNQTNNNSTTVGNTTTTKSTNTNAGTSSNSTTSTNSNNVTNNNTNNNSSNSNNNSLVNASTLPSNLASINVPSGDYYFALSSKAYSMREPASDVRNLVYNVIKNEIPNTGSVTLTAAEQKIVSSGTEAQKEALMNKLGANSLLINVTLTDSFPDTDTYATAIPSNFANGQFYYTFTAATLAEACESTSNLNHYNGMVSTNGTLISQSEFNTLSANKGMYVLGIQSGPAYAVGYPLNL